MQISNYTGESLHILAGGSINAHNNTVTASASLATENDVIRPANPNLFNGADTIGSLADVTLSNGELITVDGRLRATVDLRAGIFVNIINTSNNDQALVLLTNQYRPRAGVTGNIAIAFVSAQASGNPDARGGDVLILAEDDIAPGIIQTFGDEAATTRQGDIVLGQIFACAPYRLSSKSRS